MLYIKEFLAIVILGLVVALNLADVLYDYREGAAAAHLISEGLLTLLSFSLIGGLGLSVWRQSRDNRRLKRELAESAARAAAQPPAEMQAARHHLAVMTEKQFEAWELTQTEKEVAMLLLKGLSFKEIASVRDTLEKTVRQQASSIYRKSGLSGRHEFAAWFIEDFL